MAMFFFIAILFFGFVNHRCEGKGSENCCFSYQVSAYFAATTSAQRYDCFLKKANMLELQIFFGEWTEPQFRSSPFFAYDCGNRVGEFTH
jgi:hypothetical protein